MTPETPNKSRIAWRVVAVSAVGVFLIFGVRLSFTVFFAEFTIRNGWSSGAAASIFSLNMLVFAFVSTPAGMLLDRWGPRTVFSIGSFILACSLILSSQATQIIHLQLSYGLLGGVALGMMGLGLVASIVAGWLPHRRGTAIGITFAGTGLSALVFVPMCERLITWFGWQGAYMILAGVCMLILLPLMAFGQRRPPIPLRQKSEPTGNRRDLLRQPAFWGLLLVSFLSLGPLRSLTVHQVAYMESVGIDRLMAARFVGIAGFLTIGAFIVWGYISDRIGRARTYILGAGCLIGAVGILLVLKTRPSLWLLPFYSLLVALGEGTRSSQTTALANDIYRDSGPGFVNGIVGAMFGLGAAVIPWLVGYLRDATDSYTAGFELIIAATLVSAIGFAMTGLLSRRQRQPVYA